MTFYTWKSCINIFRSHAYDNKWTHKSLRSIVCLCLAVTLSACEHTTTQIQQNSVLINPELGLSTSIHEKNAEYWSSVFAANQSDKNAAINLSRILRVINREMQALIVMQKTVEIHPNEPDVLVEFGKVLIQNKRLNDAMQVIQHVQSMGQQDWQLLSAYGTALDKRGKHTEARNYYVEALLLAPDTPIILNNLGMSYALDNNPEQAEIMLRKAVNQPHASDQVYANLALVLGLQGKFDEAEYIAKFVLPSSTAKNNTIYLKSMMNQSDSWSQLQSLEK